MDRYVGWGEMLHSWLGKEVQGKRKLCAGDVISVHAAILDRESLFSAQHFGIWTGRDVILYGERPDGEEGVYRCSLDEFQKGKTLYLYDFPRSYGPPRRRQASALLPRIPPWDDRPQWDILDYFVKRRQYHLYTPEQTVARAEAELRRRDVYYPTSEHFAMWCKTGVSGAGALADLRCWLIFEKY